MLPSRDVPKRAKMPPRWPPDCSWAALGSLLVGLEALLAALGPLLAPLGALLFALEPLWNRTGSAALISPHPASSPGAAS